MTFLSIIWSSLSHAEQTFLIIMLLFLIAAVLWFYALVLEMGFGRLVSRLFARVGIKADDLIEPPDDAVDPAVSAYLRDAATRTAVARRAVIAADLSVRRRANVVVFGKRVR